MTTYRERFQLVFQSGNSSAADWQDCVAQLAQLIFANDRCRSRADCLVQALEEYELMTGHYCDPTIEQWDDLLYSIW